MDYLLQMPRIAMFSAVQLLHKLASWNIVFVNPVTESEVNSAQQLLKVRVVPAHEADIPIHGMLPIAHAGNRNGRSPTSPQVDISAAHAAIAA